jgi:PTS system nitrogen regulatory IIA component
MKLSDFFKEDNVIPDLKSGDKKNVLEELVQTLVTTRPSLDKGSLLRVLLERERLGSTGIGDGVAIPHGKFRGIKEPIICFGRSPEGIDFDSMDGQPVHLFFLLVAPEDSASSHLKVLARIAKILKNGSFRKLLLESSSREDLYKSILQDDYEF